MTGNQEINAFCFPDHPHSLTFSIGTEEKTDIRIPDTAVIGDDDKLTAFFLHAGKVKLRFPGVGEFVISWMDKTNAGIVDGQIPAGDIHVFKAQDADFVLMSIDCDGFDDIGRKDVFSGFMGRVTSVITGIRCQDGNPVFLQPMIGIAHDIP